jgi:hypothetical protein
VIIEEPTVAQRAAVHQRPATQPAIGTERQRATAALSRLLTRLLSPAARQRGFASVEVIEEWPKVVGPGLARRCHPVRLDFRRGATTGGTLVLQASGGAALELQHAAPQLVERVNDYFGFPAVARLRLVQMPLKPPPPAPAAPTPRPLTAAEEAALASEVAPLGDSELARALAALGRSIKARRPAA